MKKQLLFVVLVLFLIQSNAQHVYRTTEYVGNVPASDETGIDIIKDSDGNMYAIGQIDNGSNLDISLSKFDAFGSFVWEKIYDNGGDDTPLKVEIGESNNIYLTGNSDVGSTNKALIAKYSPSGSLLWDVHEGGIAGKTLVDSRTNLAGKTVLVGYYNANSTDINGFVVKYDSDGSLSWNKTYDSGSASDDEDKINAVTVSTANGDVYVGGKAGNSNSLLIRYSASGTLQWTRTPTGKGIFDIVGGGTSTNYYVYFVGKKLSGSNRFPYTAKYNSSGTLQWDDLYTSSGTATEGQIVLYSGRLYTSFVNTLGDFVRKLDLSGNQAWLLDNEDLYNDENDNSNDGKFQSPSGATRLSFDGNDMFVNVLGEQVNRYNINDITDSEIILTENKIGISGASLYHNPYFFDSYKIIKNDNLLFVIGLGTENSNEAASRIALESFCIPVSQVQIDTTQYPYFGAPLYGYTYCGGQLELDVFGATTVLWEESHNFADPTSAYQLVENSDERYFYVKGMDENTCPTFDKEKFMDKPNEFLSPDDNKIDTITPLRFCSGGESQVTLLSNFATTYEHIKWVNIDNSQALSAYEDLNTASLTDYASYYAILTNQYGCIDTTAMVTTSNLTNPTVDLGADITECADYAIHLSSGNSHEDYSFVWSNGETSEDIDVYGEGIYSVTVSGSGCNDAIDEVNITRTSNPKPSLGEDEEVCLGYSYPLNANISALSYSWNTGETTQSIERSIVENTEFIVEVENAGGCTNSDTIFITAKKTGEVYVSDNVNACSGSSVNLSVDSMYVITDYFDYYEDYETHNFHTDYWWGGEECNGNQILKVGETGNTGYMIHDMTVIPGVDEFILDVNIVAAQNVTQIPIRIDGQQYYLDFVNGCGNYTHFRFTGMSSYTDDGVISVRFDDEQTYSNYGTIDLVDIYARCPVSDTYNWYSYPSGYSASTQNITVSPTEPIQYIATYDYNGCTIRDTVSVDIVTFDLGDDILICEGETAVLDAGAADSYAWSTGETTQTINVTTEGNYSVDVSKEGCDLTDNINVSFNPLPQVELGANPSICEGSSQILDAGTSNVDSYSWSTGETTQTISVSTAGVYYVTVSNACGTANDNIELIVNTNPTPTISGDLEYCEGNNTILDAGNGYISYAWNNSSNSQTTTVTAGTYSVEVEDANGCVGTSANVTVVENANPTPVISGDLEYCEGNYATLDAGSGYTSYSWSGGGATQTINIYAGSYSVEVEDANGCVGTSANVTVIENANPSPIITGNTEYCEGFNVTLDAGSGYVSYTWEEYVSPNWTETVNTQTTTVTEGDHRVIVVDANGCEGESSTTHVTENTPAVVNLTAYDATCNQANGDMGVTVESGNPESFLWNNGAETQGLNNVVAGTYTVTVTDDNGCISVFSENINEQGAPDLSSSTVDVNCPGNTDGSATITISGGVSPYTITWSDASSQTTETANNLTNGIYTVTVTDDSNCSSFETVEVLALHDNPTPVISGDTEYCEGGNVSLDAGSGYTSYTWNNAEITQNISTTAGTYTVEVEDANGCIGTSESVTVVENANPTPVISGDLSYCEGNNTVLDAGTYTSFTWSNADVTQTTTVTAGTYSVVVEDANTCVGTSESVTVIENPLPTVFLGNDTTICEDESLLLDAGNFVSYLWNDGSELQTMEVSNTGLYSVEITDINGCSNTDEINVEVTVCTGITQNKTTYSLDVYPNPASQYLNITANNIQIKNIKILNVTGKVIFKAQSNTRIDISNLSNGIYFLKIELNQEIKLVKFVKE